GERHRNRHRYERRHRRRLRLPPCASRGVARSHRSASDRVMLFAFFTGVALALRSIVRSTLRASLTILGILIGVAAVVTVTALGPGAREQVSSQIQSMGSNVIMVAPQTASASGARGALGSGARLTEDDGRAIARESVSVVAVAPALRSRAQVVAGEKNWSAQV